jgi:REP element-mobilizing transposase RayT
VWHITHRCHKKEFLLKFAKDRQVWLDWLFEARKRLGIVILNYTVTSNHIHLLVYDREGGEVIPKSVQLSAGRTAQGYNQRKHRKGAFWEDRYHATAIQAGRHLAQCLVYIDLNMVRAGVVKYPSEWPHGGYREIQNPPERYRLIDRASLMQLLGIDDNDRLSQAHFSWVEEALKMRERVRERKWSESVAVGGLSFVEKVKLELGGRALGRQIISSVGSHELREQQVSYTGHFGPENADLDNKNRLFWRVYDEDSIR